MSSNRRYFLQQSATFVLGVSAMPLLRKAPSDTIRMGAIGINGMGWTNVRSHLKVPDVEMVALRDVDNTVLQRRAGELTDMTGKDPLLYSDFRALLDNPD